MLTRDQFPKQTVKQPELAATPEGVERAVDMIAEMYNVGRRMQHLSRTDVEAGLSDQERESLHREGLSIMSGSAGFANQVLDAALGEKFGLRIRDRADELQAAQDAVASTLGRPAVLAASRGRSYMDFEQARETALRRSGRPVEPRFPDR